MRRPAFSHSPENNLSERHGRVGDGYVEFLAQEALLKLIDRLQADGPLMSAAAATYEATGHISDEQLEAAKRESVERYALQHRAMGFLTPDNYRGLLQKWWDERMGEGAEDDTDN